MAGPIEGVSKSDIFDSPKNIASNDGWVYEIMDKILKKFPGPGIRTRDLSSEKPGFDDFTTETTTHTDRF